MTPAKLKCYSQYHRQNYPEVPRISPHLLAIQLRELWPALSQEFSCVFQYKKDADSPVEIDSACFSAIGSVAELKVLINKTQIKYQVEIENTTILTKHFPRDIESLGYPDFFKNLGPIIEKTKKLLCQHFHIPEEDHKSLCFFGGWKSIKMAETFQEIAVFTLPKMTLAQKNGLEVRQFIVDDSAKFSIDNLKYFPPEEASFLKRQAVFQNTNLPERAEYIKKLTGVLEKIRESAISKVVLSRKKHIELTEAPDPLKMSFLLAKNYWQVYDYSFQWNGKEFWFGVSPEVLLQKSERHIITKPLAGTRKTQMGDGIQEDDRFRNDPKENLEHELAVNQMMSDLENICEYEKLINYSRKNILRLNYASHIKSEIYGYLKEGKNTFDVLSKLYPPATIWGVPKELGEKLIADFEQFERSFFTGGLGYFTLEDESNFALVIRSARLEGKSLELFAGGGIVKNSIPELEWEEAQAKMTPLLSLICEESAQ
ncbi:MAG: chorismate-binding protein [SAR324 cluster bacterium]|nr:chorismate-binding protein [SAR324 cluster bacterium]